MADHSDWSFWLVNLTDHLGGSIRLVKLSHRSFVSEKNGCDAWLECSSLVRVKSRLTGGCAGIDWGLTGWNFVGFVRFAARAPPEDRVPFTRQKLYRFFSQSTTVPLQAFYMGGRPLSMRQGGKWEFSPSSKPFVVEELLRVEVMFNLVLLPLP